MTRSRNEIVELTLRIRDYIFSIRNIVEFGFQIKDPDDVITVIYNLDKTYLTISLEKHRLCNSPESGSPELKQYYRKACTVSLEYDATHRILDKINNFFRQHCPFGIPEFAMPADIKYDIIQEILRRGDFVENRTFPKVV